MGDAIISRRGSKAKLRGIRIATPPHRTIYVPIGIIEMFNPCGMVVMADIGGVEVQVTDYTYEDPGVFTTAGSYNITVSYTKNGITKTAIQPITVMEPDPVLANNSWATIAAISASGWSSIYWKVGDEKAVTIGGKSYTAQIIGFSQDKLYTADPCYNMLQPDKAGITFRLKTPYTGTYPMSGTAIGYGQTWENSTIRNTTLPSIKQLMPTELSANIRTIHHRYTSRTDTTTDIIWIEDDLFLLSCYEYGLSVVYEERPDADWYVYQYYAAGNSPYGSATQWTRSKSLTETSNSYFYALTTTEATEKLATDKYAIYPAFCV